MKQAVTDGCMKQRDYCAGHITLLAFWAFLFRITDYLTLTPMVIGKMISGIAILVHILCFHRSYDKLLQAVAQCANASVHPVSSRKQKTCFTAATIMLIPVMVAAMGVHTIWLSALLIFVYCILFLRIALHIAAPKNKMKTQEKA